MFRRKELIEPFQIKDEAEGTVRPLHKKGRALPPEVKLAGSSERLPSPPEIERPHEPCIRK